MELKQLETLPLFNVQVDFGAGIPGNVQGPALLLLERYLREHVPAQVFKRERPDDLKRRRDMSDDDRKRL